MALFGGGIEAARLVIGVGVNGADAAAREIQGLSGNITRLGSNIAGVGMGMTAGITLPVLGMGAAIWSVAEDFDTALRRVVGLTDVTADEIDDVRAAILAVAAETGKAPTELANAFYFLASAGLDTSEAMDVLAQSARAGAAGLGDTQVIAQVTGTALNAFSEQGLTATQAIDTLIGAVKKGTAEPAEFAASLGAVAGSAAQIGATFPDVTAAMAAMTLRGIDASEAAVSLNQVFVSLFKPTRQAEEALKEMGLTAGGLRDMIGQQGLLPVLELLSDRFGGNEEAAAAVFGNIRALRGILALTGGDAAQVADVFADVNAATGALGEAFAATEGPGREAGRAMASMQETLISLGETVLPMISGALNGLRDLLAGVRQWWDSLDEGTKQMVVTFAAVVAAAGPVLLILGLLVSGIGLLLSPIGLIVAALAALAVAWATDFAGIRTALQPVVEFIVGALGAVAKVAIPLLIEAVRIMVGIVGALFKVWGGIISAAFTLVQPIVTAIIGLFGSLGRGIGDAMATGATLFRGAVNTIIGFINRLIWAWNSLYFRVPRMDLGPLGTFGGFTIGLPKLGTIPYLQSGAWDLLSDTLAFLHRGEMVVPAGPAEAIRSMMTGRGGGGGGITVMGPLVRIENFHGTDGEVRALSEKLATEVRLRFGYMEG